MSDSQNLGAVYSEIPPQFSESDLTEAAGPPDAIGFPKALVFRAQPCAEDRSYAAVYYPRLDTFVAASSCRKLTYQWIWGDGFHVDVLYSVHTGWLLYKFRSGSLLWQVSANSYEQALGEALARGLEPGEPAAPDVQHAST